MPTCCAPVVSVGIIRCDIETCHAVGRYERSVDKVNKTMKTMMFHFFVAVVFIATLEG